MLNEIALCNIKKLPKNSIVIEVTRSKNHILSPSWKILNQYKKDLNWDNYVKNFKKEMLNPSCIDEMKKIIEMSKSHNVYLACYEINGNCHRHLLIKWMNLLKL